MRHRAPRNLLALLRLRWRRPRRRAAAAAVTHPSMRLIGALAAAFAVIAGTMLTVGQLGGEEVPTGAPRPYAVRSAADEPSRSSGRTALPGTGDPDTPSVPSAPDAAAAPTASAGTQSPVRPPSPTPEQPDRTETRSPLDLPSAQAAASVPSPDVSSAPTGEQGGLTPSDDPSPTQASPTGSGDDDPPQTTIVSGPSTQGSVTQDDSRFVFDADEAATFVCSLDGQRFRPCASPQRYDGLDAGPHEFAVRAIDQAGNVDPTPDRYSWVTTGLGG
jgi:hypothetical protein